MPEESKKRRRWVFHEGEPGSAVLLTPTGDPHAGKVARRLLTTVSEVAASVLVVWYPDRERTWLEQWPDDLDYELNNLRTVQITDGSDGVGKDITQNRSSLSSFNTIETSIIHHFEDCTEKNVQPILLLDSLSVLVESFGPDQTQKFVEQIVRASKKASAQTYFHVGINNECLAGDVGRRTDVTAIQSLDGRREWIIQ